MAHLFLNSYSNPPPPMQCVPALLHRPTVLPHRTPGLPHRAPTIPRRASATMQGTSKTSCSKPRIMAHLFLNSHSSPPPQGHSPITQDTSHPPSLLPNWGHSFRYTYARNLATMSDVLKRSGKPQKPAANLVQTSTLS